MGWFKKKERTAADFGKHPNDIEHRVKFPEQIRDIGRGTKYGAGEIVEVDMRSGKTALYKLFSDTDGFGITADDTGQKNWKYLFIDYKDNTNKDGAE